jgi:hypothetical protein
MARPISAVRESLARQRAIAGVTRREIIRHCQPLALSNGQAASRLRPNNENKTKGKVNK